LARTGSPGRAGIVDALSQLFARSRQQALIIGKDAERLSGLESAQSEAVAAPTGLVGAAAVASVKRRVYDFITTARRDVAIAPVVPTVAAVNAAEGFLACRKR
jgi:hypothetical protein